MDEISVEELAALLEDDDVRVVDVRSPSAYRRGHVPGSDNIPFAELTSRVEELRDADRVVTVCPHGEASVQAARLVESYEGFEGEAASLSPGIEGWAERHGLETEPPDAGSAEAEPEDAPF